MTDPVATGRPRSKVRSVFRAIGPRLCALRAHGGDRRGRHRASRRRHHLHQLRRPVDAEGAGLSRHRPERPLLQGGGSRRAGPCSPTPAGRASARRCRRSDGGWADPSDDELAVIGKDPAWRAPLPVRPAASRRPLDETGRQEPRHIIWASSNSRRTASPTRSSRRMPAPPTSRSMPPCCSTRWTTRCTPITWRQAR